MCVCVQLLYKTAWCVNDTLHCSLLLVAVSRNSLNQACNSYLRLESLCSVTSLLTSGMLDVLVALPSISFKSRI